MTDILAMERRHTREINQALRSGKPVVAKVAIEGVDTTRQIRIIEYRAKRGGQGFQGKTISTGLWYDVCEAWVAL